MGKSRRCNHGSEKEGFSWVRGVKTAKQREKKGEEEGKKTEKIKRGEEVVPV